MTIQTKVLPPVPTVTPLVQQQIMVTENWSRWFVALREKVNTINAASVSLANLTTKGAVVSNGSGNFATVNLLAGTYGDSTHVAQVTVGANGYITNITSVALAIGTGTVTSVGLAAPTQFTVTGSPVTTAGTLTFAWNTQTANTVLAGPTTGSPAVPTFRVLVSADIPALDFSKITTGIVPVSQGGTGVATTNANLVFAGPTSGGIAAPSFRALVSADLPTSTPDIAYLWTII